MGGGVDGGALRGSEVLLGVVFLDGAVRGGGGGEVGSADLSEIGVQGEDVCVLHARLIRVRVEGKREGEEYYSVRFFQELIGGVGAGTRVGSEMSIVLLEEGVEEGGQICHCMGGPLRCLAK